MYYECPTCAVTRCPACAGRGRATGMWHGFEFVQDSELWSLDSSKEFSKVMRSRFRSLGFHEGKFNWERFVKDSTVPMTPGYIGCQIAHFECWREADFPDWLLVIEDDAVPIPVMGLDWVDVFGLLCNEIAELRVDGEEWDLLWVGRSLSMSCEQEMLDRFAGLVPSLLIEPGYVVGMHCYCLSRRGLKRLLQSELPRTVVRPIDEMIGALNLGGRHPRERFEARIMGLGSSIDLKNWRSLAFPYLGLAVQMCDLDHYRDFNCSRSQDALEQYLS